MPNYNSQSLIKSQNWKDESIEFFFFSEKETKRWIQEGFDKDQAREWIKIKWFRAAKQINPAHFYFLTFNKGLSPQKFSELEDIKKEELNKESVLWIKPFIFCNYCQKRELKENFYFTNQEKELNLCSSDCKKKWNYQAQDWLNKWYPKDDRCLKENEYYIHKEGDKTVLINNLGKTREQIIDLYLVDKNIIGSLDLKDFINLKSLNCYQNELLVSLNLTNNIKLERLVISKNFFEKQNPSWLGNLINLIALFISDKNFVGSLEFTKNLTKLEYLSIEGSSFTSGLEFLPLSLKSFDCSNNKIKEILENCHNEINEETEGSFYLGRLKSWRKKNDNLVNSAQAIISFESNYKSIFDSLNRAFSLKKDNFWWTKDKLTLNAIFNPQQSFYYWLEEKIREIEKLRKENEKYYQDIYDEKIILYQPIN